jgi:hypothetical protein
VDALAQAGMVEIAPSHSVLDVTLRQLQALAAAYGVVARWDIMITRPDMTLANVLKILPMDDAVMMEALITAAGLLPDSG